MTDKRNDIPLKREDKKAILSGYCDQKLCCASYLRRDKARRTVAAIAIATMDGTSSHIAMIRLKCLIEDVYFDTTRGIVMVLRLS